MSVQAEVERVCRKGVLRVNQRSYLYTVGMFDWQVIVSLAYSLVQCGLTLEVEPDASDKSKLRVYAVRRTAAVTVEQPT
jgi:hypothetical protein